METKEQIPLSSAEVSLLWVGFQHERLLYNFFKHFELIVEDKDFLKNIKSSRMMYKKHFKEIEEILKKENFPVPIGITEHDLNIDAPRLFSDNTAIYFLFLLNRAGILYYTTYIHSVARKDIRKFLLDSLNEYVQSEDEIANILLEKGLFVRPPHVPYPDNVDIVKKESFLTGWFGDRRPLTVTQITNLHLDIFRNTLAKTFLIGFSQTVKTDELRELLKDGVEMAEEKIDSFSLYLKDIKHNIVSPAGLSVTDSTKSPYSDKLIIMLLISIIRYAICFYGQDISSSTRRDLYAFYNKLTGETTLFLNKTLELAIKLGYLEEEPKAIDYKEIVDKLNT